MHFLFVLGSLEMVPREFLVTAHLAVVFMNGIIIPASPEARFQGEIGRAADIVELRPADIELPRPRNDQREEQGLARTLVAPFHLVDAIDF